MSDTDPRDMIATVGDYLAPSERTVSTELRALLVDMVTALSSALDEIAKGDIAYQGIKALMLEQRRQVAARDAVIDRVRTAAKATLAAGGEGDFYAGRDAFAETVLELLDPNDE